MEGEVITLQKLFEFKIDRFDAERRIVGELHPTGLRPGFLGKFERHGIELPLSLFGGTASAIYGARRAGAARVVEATADEAPSRARSPLCGRDRSSAPRVRPPGAADRGARDRPGHAAAVSRARLRRQRPGVALDSTPRSVEVRENGLRVTRRARRPAGGQRTPLRRRPRARREREHDRRAVRRGARRRSHLRLAPNGDRGGRHRRVQRRRLGAAAT